MSEHELWNELGNLYFMAGAYDQAVHAYHHSIQLDESYGRPYSNLALIYARQGKQEMAARLFRKSLALLQDTREKAISWNRLGNLYRQARNYPEAVVAFQNADDLDPECRDGREQMGQMLYATSDLSILERAQQLKDTEPSRASAAPPTSAPQIGAAASVSTLEEGFHEELSADAPEDEWLTPWVELGEDAELTADLERLLGTAEHPLVLEADYEDETAAEYVLPDRFPLSVSLPVRPVTLVGADAAGSAAQAVEVELLERPEPTASDADSNLPSDGGSDEAQDAQAALGARDADEAELEFDKLQRMVRQSITPAWDPLGNLHKSMGRYQDALLAYQQAVQ
jgi:tetratricopeptide (TPR) repeat protein